MSFIFDIDGETTWSPSLRTGQVYAAYCQALASVLDTPTGFTFLSEDWVDIDRQSFTAFVGRVMDTYQKTAHHPVLEPLLRVVLACSLVMLERAGVTWSPAPEPKLRAFISEMAAAMPR